MYNTLFFTKGGIERPQLAGGLGYFSVFVHGMRSSNYWVFTRPAEKGLPLILGAR